MAFRVLDCFDAIRHTLGGKPSSEISMVSLVNEAGEHLVNMHGWRWLLRATATLDAVAGQGYLTLPADIGTIITLELTNGATGGTLQPVTLQEILAWRTQTVPGQTFTRYWAASYGLADGIPTPRIELYPVPDTDAAGAYTLWYAATWVAVEKEIDPIPVPAWIRPLFLAIVRAFAQGYQNEDQATVDARLAALMGGPLFLSAADRDKVLQPSYGALIDNEMSSNWWQDQVILDP